MGDLNADASASSKPPISSSAHSISTMDRMATADGDRYTRRTVGNPVRRFPGVKTINVVGKGQPLSFND